MDDVVFINDKEPLAKGMGYPLRSSDLAACIAPHVGRPLFLSVGFRNDVLKWQGERMKKADSFRLVRMELDPEAVLRRMADARELQATGLFTDGVPWAPWLDAENPVVISGSVYCMPRAVMKELEISRESVARVMAEAVAANLGVRPRAVAWAIELSLDPSKAEFIVVSERRPSVRAGPLARRRVKIENDQPRE